MCGLYGFTTIKPDKKNTKALKMLAIYNMERGEHSTGVYYTNGKNKLIKDAIPANKFIDKYDLSGIDNASICIGHTRYATTGQVTKDNAHPFVIGDIVGTHNGIINNYAKFGEYTVDSMVIFDLLDKNNNDYKKVLPKLEGSVALAYIYKDKLFLTRKDNPLFLLKSDTTVFYSSIENSLLQLRALLNIDSMPIELPTNRVLTLEGINGVETKVNYKKTATSTWHNFNHYHDLDTYTAEELEEMTGLTENDKVFSYALEDLEYSGCSTCDKDITSNSFYYSLDMQMAYHLRCLPKKLEKSTDLYLIDVVNGTADKVNE